MTLQTIRHQNLIPASLLKPDEHAVLSENSTISQTSPALKQLVYLIDELKKDSLAISLLHGKLANSILIYVRTNSAADSLAENVNVAESVTVVPEGPESMVVFGAVLSTVTTRAVEVVELNPKSTARAVNVN